ncbi:MAG: hypothetical protein DDT18_01802 [Actinobacteria bacterium]|nr:hypothetical protein [Actinomycetota bacterium]
MSKLVSTIDIRGHIYLTDTLFNSVQIFDKSGQALLVFGRQGMNSGEFSLPAGISISRDDKIYVADSYNMRVQVFRYLKAGEGKGEGKGEGEGEGKGEGIGKGKGEGKDEKRK